MSEQTIERISEIHIANSRPRARARWQLMVPDIREVGLKKLVTVARRTTPSSDRKIFDLICGKGRVEAFIALEETHLPVVIIEARREDQFLMSLVENIARYRRLCCYFQQRSILRKFICSSYPLNSRQTIRRKQELQTPCWP